MPFHAQRGRVRQGASERVPDAPWMHTHPPRACARARVRACALRACVRVRVACALRACVCALRVRVACARCTRHTTEYAGRQTHNERHPPRARCTGRVSVLRCYGCALLVRAMHCRGTPTLLPNRACLEPPRTGRKHTHPR